MKTEKLDIRIPGNLKQKLKDIGESQEASASEVITDLIKNVLAIGDYSHSKCFVFDGENDLAKERLAIRMTKTLKQRLQSLTKDEGIKSLVLGKKLNVSMIVAALIRSISYPRKSTTPEPTSSPELTYFSRETPKTLKVAEASTGYEV